MRDLQAYGKFCMEILEDLHIPYGQVVSLTVNTRARRWGQCRKIPGGLYEININQTLLDEKNAEDGLVNTILHELLHTCPGCMNHGQEWKKYAEMVRKNWGYDVKRTSSEEDKGVTTGNLNARERRENPYKYEVRCPRCGVVARRKTRCDLIENIGKYRCGICKGSLYTVTVDGMEKAANSAR